MDKKYYYFVAKIQKDAAIVLYSGTLKTSDDDFPLMYIRKSLAEQENVPQNRIIISFYKEITESNYKAYNNEQ